MPLKGVWCAYAVPAVPAAPAVPAVPDTRVVVPSVPGLCMVAPGKTACTRRGTAVRLSREALELQGLPGTRY